MAGVITERIAKDPSICGGNACIAGHRVRVMDIAIMYEQMGMSPDDIVTEIPTITLSDVHAALAYYYDHLDEIRSEIQNSHDYADEFRSNNPSALQDRLEKLVGDAE